MIVYATHEGGRYLLLKDSLKEQPEGKRGLYINLTNRCNCACTFCLRNMKKMAEESTLWLKEEPSVDEVKAELDNVPWEYIKEIVFCGFGEPTYKVAEMVALCDYFHEKGLKTRLNTNGQGNLINKRDIVPELKDKIDFVNISLNAACVEK